MLSMKKWAHGILSTSDLADRAWGWSQFGGSTAQIQDGVPWQEAVSILGELGWELVSVASYDDAQDLWFKKQI